MKILIVDPNSRSSQVALRSLQSHRSSRNGQA
jgi:hypothetical protein